MKKRILATMMMLLIVVLSTVSAQIVQVPIGITYTEAKFSPYVFLNRDGGRMLYDDPYGLNGDITSRENNYAFTGEQIEWTVLVWDKNGVPENIYDVFAGWGEQSSIDPEIQANCHITIPQPIDGELLSEHGYYGVRRDGEQSDEEFFNKDTMGEYICTVTVEPSCHGQKWFGVKAVDLDGLSGTMNEAESWFCNPELSLSVSGSLDFGELGSGEHGSATIVVGNTAEQGAGVNVIMAISGTNFYDPSHSGAVCPTSNQLSLQGDQSEFTTSFWYTATQGSYSIGNKRIPFGTDISDSDPIFSTSTEAQQWRRWTGLQNLPYLTTGGEISMTFHLGIPMPCNGQFTDGNIFLYAFAI